MSRRRVGTVLAVLLASALVALGCATEEERLDAHLERAEEYAEQDRDKEALIELRSALQLEPKSAEINLRIARLLEERDETGDALFFYREAHRLDPERSDAALALARLLMGSEPERAGSLIEGVLEREPENVTAHRRRAELALVRRDTEAALAAARRALEAAPEDPRSHMQVGLVRRAEIRRRRQDGEEVPERLFEQALEAFARTTELAEEAEVDPAVRVRARLERARTYAMGRRHEEAERAFREAVEHASEWPELEESAVGSALAYARRQERPALERWGLERLVELDSARLEAWSALASLADDTGGSGVDVLERLAEARPDDPEALELVGRGLAARGKRAEAIERLSGWARDMEEAAPLWAALVELHLGSGDVGKAQTALARLREAHPEAAETRVAEAELDLSQGRPGRAAEALRVLVGNVESAKAQRLLAQAEQRLGNLAEARAAIERAFELTEGRPPVSLLRLRGVIEVRSQDWEAAVRSFRRVWRRRGKTLPPVEARLMARALYESGRTDAARTWIGPFVESEQMPLGQVLEFVRHERSLRPDLVRRVLERALEKYPGRAELLTWLTRMDLEEGRTEEARERLDAALEGEPEAPAALHELRARVRLAQGDTEGALADAQRAAELDPEGTRAVPLTARLLAGEGRLDEAVETLEEREEKGELAASERRLLARFHRERGDLRSAVDQLEKVLETEEDARVKNDLAYLLATQGTELERALELAREAQSAFPESPDVADTLGLVYLRQGLMEAAADQLRFAVKLAEQRGEERPGAHYRLGVALKMQGKREEAMEAFERSLEGEGNLPHGEEARRELELLAEQTGAEASSS